MRLTQLAFISSIGAAVVAAHVLLKASAEAMLPRETVVVLTPFLNLRLGFNPGVALAYFKPPPPRE